MIMGVAADDITGSNDIGIMFASSGCPAFVYTFEEPGQLDGAILPDGPADVCILNTNSRLDIPQVAYRKVYAATLALQAAGSQRFFKKTCSVFRGNIGAEFDAMLDALGAEFAVVVLGFPKNGRITRGGVHYVHGRLLEESEFRSDPIHPMVRSDLVDILSAQTGRQVASLHADTVAAGPALLRSRIEEMKARCNYLILDVTCQEDLSVIAEAVYDEPVLCGSSAVAEALPAAWGISPGPDRVPDLPVIPGMGVLVASGSLMPQTVAQVRYLYDQGVAGFELDAMRLFDPDGGRGEVERLAGQVGQELAGGHDVVFHTAQDPDRVEQTRAAGRSRRLTDVETARLVSAAVAEVSAQALELAGQNRLVVAGGETSAAVCTRLGVTGLEIWKEIEPGLPACISIPADGSPDRMMLVLKSGSFGTDAFLHKALSMVRA